MSAYGQPEYGKSGTLYDTEPQREFILGEGGALNEDIGFACYSAIVDNPTVQWVHIVDTNHYIPPGVVGFVVRLPGVGRAQAEWAAPIGQVQPSAIPGTFALIIFTHEQLPPGGATVSTTSLNKQQTPNIANYFTVSGPGVTTIEPAAPGQQLYVLAGILMVEAAVPGGGGLLALEEQQPSGLIGRTIAAIKTEQVTDGIPFQAFGFIVTPGWGLQLQCHFVAATCALSILYSK